ncbi:MAG: hypothetical protein MJ156_00345 [Alphaproteobacteria bacterium]|nr:hypothetical protein [Alphaproteobacteria bacterium]
MRKHLNLFSDIHFDAVPPTQDEIEALAKATTNMIMDPTNTTIAVMLDNNGNAIQFTR